ncbi:hypothetical protein C8J57DRAFT_1533843 [Mycena rebaudengoi]|nr:hypothetical protein C8J57DRAFT_1533843 [Mycena rebaudengoi]
MKLPSSLSNPFIAPWPRQAPSETPVRRSYNRANNPFTPAAVPMSSHFPQPIFETLGYTPFMPDPAPAPGDTFSAAYPPPPASHHTTLPLPPLAIPPQHSVPPQPHSAPPFYPPTSFAPQQLTPATAPSISSNSWMLVEFLDLARRNHLSWSKKVLQTLGMNGGLFLWLDTAHVIPPCATYPRDHSAWLSNDMAVHSFLQPILTVPEHSHIAKCATAADAWTMLKVRHEQVGTVMQMELLREFFEVHYSNDPTKMAATSTQLSELNDTIWAASVPDPAMFLTWGMINALSPFPALRNQVIDIADSNTTKIEKRLAILGTFDSLSHPTANAVYSTNKAKEPKELCTTSKCPRPNTHTWTFCVQLGGGMAGKKVSEAQDAQRQAQAKKDGRGGAQANSAQASALLYDPAIRPFLKDISGKV